MLPDPLHLNTCVLTHRLSRTMILRITTRHSPRSESHENTLTSSSPRFPTNSVYRGSRPLILFFFRGFRDMVKAVLTKEILCAPST